jgi:hypothetical protein
MQATSVQNFSPTPLVRAASSIAAAIMAGLTVLEIGLAAGLPWGKAAWGGTQSVLSPGMRLASVGAAAVWIAASLLVLRLGGRRVWSPLPNRWIRTAVWIIAAYAALMVLGNGASGSSAERAIMTPTSLVLAVTCGLAALRGKVPSTATSALQ